MSVIEWLLDGDPAIRWQVLRDLTDASPDEVAAERARVEHEGWGARLLALEDADGLWDGGACFPARLHRRRTGPAVDGDDAHAADPAAPRARPGVGVGPPGDRARRRERALGARRAAVLRRRGRAVHQRPDDRDRRVLRGRRRADRRADPRRAARRRRLELRGRERIGALVVRHDDQRARRAARVRAGDRRRPPRCARPGAAARSTCSSASLFRRKSTGEVVDAGVPRASRSRTTGTTTCCARSTTSAASGAEPDPRMAEAVEVVRSKRQPDGRWLLDRIHPGSRPLRPRGASGRRAAGTPSARCACSTGGTASRPAPSGRRAGRGG